MSDKIIGLIAVLGFLLLAKSDKTDTGCLAVIFTFLIAVGVLVP